MSEKLRLQNDQPGVMPTKSTFNHLMDIEDPQPSPYTLAVLLAHCPDDLRLKGEQFVLSPNEGNVRMP